MKKLGMNALLAVGQGSAQESQLVIMRWDGRSKDDKTVSLIGKGSPSTRAGSPSSLRVAWKT